MIRMTVIKVDRALDILRITTSDPCEAIADIIFMSGVIIGNYFIVVVTLNLKTITVVIREDRNNNDSDYNQ
jgi:hypothetical protein